MKIRNGFVSNSSSSAFIIDLSDITIYDLNLLSKEFAEIRIVSGQIEIEYNDKQQTKQFLKDSGILPRINVKWTNIN